MKKALFILICAAAGWSSCSNKCKDLKEPASVYHIDVGDKIEFETKSCRDCAMDWFWKNSTNEHLKLIDEDEDVCGKGTNNMGSTIRTFVFEGVKSGSDSIVLHEKHSFDPVSVQPNSTKVIYVHIH